MLILFLFDNKHIKLQENKLIVINIIKKVAYNDLNYRKGVKFKINIKVFYFFKPSVISLTLDASINI
jgi:hypothetical protein